MRIAWNSNCDADALQGAQMMNQSRQLFAAQIAECGHAVAGKAILQDSHQVGVRARDYLAAGCDVGSTFSAAAVAAVTCGAVSGKERSAVRRWLRLCEQMLSDSRCGKTRCHTPSDQGYSITFHSLLIVGSIGGRGKSAFLPCSD